jgi:thioesterase domain-containing protein/acyl carrier protein
LVVTKPDATAPAIPVNHDITVVGSSRPEALLSRLQTVFADLSGVDPAILVPDATFLEIGFDSLFLTQAASALQNQFATEITLRTLVEDVPTLNLLVERILPTLPEEVLPDTTPVAAGRMYRPADRDECVAFLRGALQLTEQQRAIVPLEAGGTRTPIFALGGHNGDVFAYRALALHLGPDQPFFGLQPPGVEEGSEPLTRVEDIAHYFAEQIRAFRPVGPISIAGFCAGGTIAFELARELTDSGASVTNLILFGAPYYETFRPLEWKMAQARTYASRLVTHGRALRTMSVAERARYIAERARRPRRRQEVSDPVLIRRGAVEEATMAAVLAYSPEPSSTHVDFMIPSEASKRSWVHPLRWSRLAASSTVFVGPDGCDTDNMLLPENAAIFAAFVADAQRRNARGGVA